MAKQTFDLGVAGKVKADLTLDWARKMSDDTDVDISVYTLFEDGDGIYTISATVTEDARFRLHVTADPTKYAVAGLSPADGNIALDSTVAKETTLETKASQDSVNLLGTYIDTEVQAIIDALVALQIDVGDPSAETPSTSINAKIEALKNAVALLPVNPVNILSATKGAIQVSYAKDGGTVEVVQGDTISIPYGPLGKDITGRRLYFAAKDNLEDEAFSIAVKEITAQITDAATFTGTIPLTSAELSIAVGQYYAEIKSRDADGTSSPVTELKFMLKVVRGVM